MGRPQGFCLGIPLCELADCYAFAQRNGLSSRWLQRKAASGVLKSAVPVRGRTKGGAISYLVSAEEVRRLVLECGSPRSIRSILESVWFEGLAKRMWAVANKAHGHWRKHFNVPREGNIALFVSSNDFYRLRPRYAFFHDNRESIEKLLPIQLRSKFLEILNELWISGSSHLRSVCEQFSRSNFRNNYMDERFNYEATLFMGLDMLMDGMPISEAFQRALEDAPRFYDSKPKKECAFEGVVFERIAKTLYNEEDRLATRLSLEKVLKELDEEDRQILLLHAEGLSDTNIKQSLSLDITRQGLNRRRLRLLEQVRAQL